MAFKMALKNNRSGTESLIHHSDRGLQYCSKEYQRVLEKQAYVADKKAIIFDLMINLAEKEYQIDIRKNLPPEQLTTSAEKKKKL